MTYYSNYQKTLRLEHKGSSCVLDVQEDSIILSCLETMRSRRMQGNASELLEFCKSFSARRAKPLKLWVQCYNVQGTGMSNSDLLDWYYRRGFRPAEKHKHIFWMQYCSFDAARKLAEDCIV